MMCSIVSSDDEVIKSKNEKNSEVSELVNSEFK